LLVHFLSLAPRVYVLIDVDFLSIAMLLFFLRKEHGCRVLAGEVSMTEKVINPTCSFFPWGMAIFAPTPFVKRVEQPKEEGDYCPHHRSYQCGCRKKRRGRNIRKWH
jgi:hypothetical protein